MLVEIFQTFRHKSFHKYSCIIMNRVSRFVSLVKPRAIVARTTKRSMHTFGKVHDMEPQDFRLLISSEKNNFPTTSDVIDNMLIENTIENIQIVDVRELNELEKLNFTDDFSRIVHLPLSTSDNWSAKIARGDLLDSTKPTVCVCHAGIRSLRLAQFLVNECNFQQVYNLDGGIGRYEHEVDPSVRK